MTRLHRVLAYICHELLKARIVGDMPFSPNVFLYDLGPSWSNPKQNRRVFRWAFSWLCRWNNRLVLELSWRRCPTGRRPANT